MARVGLARQRRETPTAHKPFTDIRSLVIVIIAIALSSGAGLTAYAVAAAAHAGLASCLIAAIGAGGSAAVVLIRELHGLIAE